MKPPGVLVKGDIYKSEGIDTGTKNAGPIRWLQRMVINRSNYIAILKMIHLIRITLQ